MKAWSAAERVDSHSTYVALSRHRERVDLYYGRDDFANQNKLVRAASRERGKDMASDYRVKETEPTAKPKRSIFAGLKLKPTVAIEAVGKDPNAAQRGDRPRTVWINTHALEGPARSALDKAVERFARAEQDIANMRAKGLSPVIHQRNSLAAATRELDALHADGAQDLAAALRSDPSLISEAANGRTQRALQAIRAERELRLDAPGRADRFVAEWQAQAKQLRHHKGNHDYADVKRIEASLNDMAKSLHRDPQLESLLRNRTRELGLPRVETNSLSHTLQEYLRPSRSRGIGI